MTLSTMIMSSNTNNGLDITDFDASELIRFVFLCIMMQYLLKMCIVCHSASVIIE